MSQVTNITAYRFVELPDSVELRTPMLTKCKELNLKGTILLAPEGINFFMAGSKSSCDEFITYLGNDKRFRNLDVKYSLSKEQPFTRTLVRLKKEIITLRMPEIKPEIHTGPFISPSELRSWYDAGKDFMIIDTRNIYETKFGMFENAIDLNLKSFTDFPHAVDKLPEPSKNIPVVMYCTGGVRCEKASVLMLERGFEEVYQLEGGILRYLEKEKGTYWNGDCFVFDHRVCLDSNLTETDAALCFSCREPLTVEEQASTNYVVGKSCPYCV